MCSSSSDLPNPLPHSPPRAIFPLPLRLSQPSSPSSSSTRHHHRHNNTTSPPSQMGAFGFVVNATGVFVGCETTKGRVIEKALYGLHQAPRAWYETLSTYLLDNKFQRGKIDKTLFIRKDRCDILLVQVTAMLKQKDDGIFIVKGQTSLDRIMLEQAFDKKSQTAEVVNLGLLLISWQCQKQTVVANSITEAKYAAASSCCGQNGIRVIAGDSKLLLLGINLLLLGKVNAARHNLTATGEMDGKKIIVTEASVRRDLQLNDEEGTDCLPNATIFEELTRMGYEKLSQKLTLYKAFFSPHWKFLIHTILQCLSAKTTARNEFSSTIASAIIYLATNQKFNFSKYIFETMVKNLDNTGKFLMYPRFVQVFLDKQLEGMQSHKRIYVTPSHTKNIFGNLRRVGKGFSGRDTPLFPTMMVQAQQEQDEVVNEEMDDSLERAAITATSLDVEQDRGNINKTQSKATSNEPTFPVISSDGGPKRQETIGDTIARTRFENVSKTSNDSLLAGVNTPQSDEDNLQLQELMEFFKKLEKKGGSRTHKLKRLYKVGRSARIVSSDEASLGDQEDASKQGRKIDDIDKDAEITLVDETQGSKKDDAAQVNTTATTVSTASTIPVSAALITNVEITLAKALAELKSVKPTTTTSTRPRAKGLVIHEQEQAPTPIVSLQQSSQAKIQDKGKAKIIEPKPINKLSKKDQLKLDEEVAQRLQAEFDEQERIEREKAKVTFP
ncbi:ribonuclease H-like domain-containing protein [Tanacetum coccineum]|uniref:Ribonuclease H-like domain-containing protein n=1 Tax=Tanacetum coccineum TaxID=301880 RepID=A0ABQ5GS77_9ASTR